MSYRDAWLKAVQEKMNGITRTSSYEEDTTLERQWEDLWRDFDLSQQMIQAYIEDPESNPVPNSENW